MSTATFPPVQTLKTGQKIFLRQKNTGKPDDVRVCFIGEVNGDEAEIIIKKPGEGGTGVGVKAIVSTNFVGDVLVIRDEARRVDWAKNNTVFQLPTPELWALNDDKINRSRIRQALESAKTLVTTLQGQHLVELVDKAQEIESIIARLVEENPWQGGNISE